MARALFIAALALCFSAVAEPLQDVQLQHYFEGKVREISSNAASKVTTREQWDVLKPQLRTQLFEMLGLSPLPEKTDLHATITGTLEHDGVVVEKLHFQSRPDFMSPAISICQRTDPARCRRFSTCAATRS